MQGSAAHWEHLGGRFHSFLAEESFVDVEFAVDGRIFRAHRLILCAASPYFNKMFASTFCEADTVKPIPINDLSATAFEAVIGFPYTGSVDSLRPDNVCEIVRAADQVCMESMVPYCIQYLLNGHLTCDNCCAALLTASELGGHGQQLIWKPLFEECVRFVRDHLPELLKHPDNEPLAGLDAASLCAVLVAVAPSLSAQPARLMRLWDVARSWGQRDCGAGTFEELYQALSSRSYAELDHIQTTPFTFKLRRVSPNLKPGHKWKSDVFSRGGFQWHALVYRGELRDDMPEACGWYSMYIVPTERPPLPGGWGCFAACQLKVLHPERLRELQAEVATHFFSEEDITKSSGWGRSRAFRVQECEDLDAGFLRCASFAVEISVKVNPMLGLCTAAALLQFRHVPQPILRAFPVEVLDDLLRSDTLAIVDEDELLDVLIRFGAEQEDDADDDDDDMGETNSVDPMARKRQKLDHLVHHLRMGDLSFDRLLNAAKESQALQACPRFAAGLQQLLRRKLLPWQEPGPDAARGNPASSGRPRRGVRPQQIQPRPQHEPSLAAAASLASAQPPAAGADGVGNPPVGSSDGDLAAAAGGGDTNSPASTFGFSGLLHEEQANFDAFIHWLLRPSPQVRQIKEELHQSEVARDQVQARLSSLTEGPKSRLDALSRIEGVIAEQAPSGYDTVRLSGLAVKILRKRGAGQADALARPLNAEQVEGILADARALDPLMFGVSPRQIEVEELIAEVHAVGAADQAKMPEPSWPNKTNGRRACSLQPLRVARR